MLRGKGDFKYNLKLHKTIKFTTYTLIWKENKKGNPKVKD